MLAGEVFAAVREIVDDIEAEYATDERQVAFLQMAQEALVLKMLNNPNIGRAKTAVVLPNVAAGTQSLAAYFTANQPLALLTEVISMRERPTGQDDSAWSHMNPVNDLPSVVQTTYNGVFIPTGNDIQMPGATQALDFRVFGVFDPQKIINANTPLIPNTGLILKCATAAWVCRSHGNKDYAKDLAALAQDYTNTLMNTMIMELQDQNVRQRPFGSGLPANRW